MAFDEENLKGTAGRLCVLGHAMKGTLSAPLARKAIELGVRLAGGEVVSSHCISDGGDGFLDAFLEIHSGRITRDVAPDALGRLVLAEYFVDDSGDTCAIEMARVCGLAMLAPEDRDIMASGTMGLGRLIVRAHSLGASEIHIGLGGSATCDGGLGMIAEMCRCLLEVELPREHYGARDLDHPPVLDLNALKARLEGVRLVIHCDVQNPLLGPNGTAAVFAPQKGANSHQVEDLEMWMSRWADYVEGQLGGYWREVPGAGAAGGLGFALAALGATLVDGANSFLEVIGLERDIDRSDGLITCEGKFDASSFHGKGPWKAALLAAKKGRTAVIACGVADDIAVARANDHDVTILEFASLLPEERRNAEVFTLLQQAVSYFLRTGRTDAPPPLASGDRIKKL
ncbi:MAG: glycerate kinase [Candidatus Sumerlaeia bacterium]|nr:glycerate kinase [Candidatus Sumerlaeia bacterium]